MADELPEIAAGPQETIEHSEQVEEGRKADEEEAEGAETKTEVQLHEVEAKLQANEAKEKSEARRRIRIVACITIFAALCGVNATFHDKMGEDGQATEVQSNDNWAQYDSNKVIAFNCQNDLAQVQYELAMNPTPKAQGILLTEQAALTAAGAKLKKEMSDEKQAAQDHADDSDHIFELSWNFARLGMLFTIAVLLLGLCLNVPSRVLLWTGRVSGALGAIGLVYALYLLFA